MAQYPSVYPSEVTYRPGRVQTLNSDQEIALKQCWACLLAFWGYGVAISPEDIKCKESFVASSVTQQLQKTTTHRFEMSASRLKKKWSLFGRSQPKIAEVSSKRLEQMRVSETEPYQLVETPSEFVRYVYTHHYKQAFDLEDDYISDSDSDSASLESFNTARSTPTASTLKGTLIKKPSLASTPAQKVKSKTNVLPFMAKYKPRVIHTSLHKVVKNDLIDNFVLRFIRARKYVYEDSMAMITNSLLWKETEYPVEHWLLESDAPSFFSGKNKGFVKNLSVGKSFIRGHDIHGNPLFVFQSRKHFAADSLLAETERFAVVVIEWCRLFLREVNESVDLCSLMFDLTGFTLKNADNAPIKFLATMFEAHYPESLGCIIVHNAPWIFSTVWNVIKNWLDPVVLSKIHFTKGYDDLRHIIDPEHIPTYLGGKDEVDNAYPEPSKEHVLPPKKKDAKYRMLRLERDELYMKFFEVTKKWVETANPEASSQYLKDKIYLSYQMSDNYIALDPYVRNPGVYDRNGALEIRN